jgi:citrate lyase subunit beta/citryl-CoA lyase
MRSLLFVPGNNPAMVQNAGVFGSDIVILDLEDAVAPPEKDAARLLVAEALRAVDYGATGIVVRINTLDTGGLDDIAAVVPFAPAALLVPKVQSAAGVNEVAEKIAACEASGKAEIKIIALIETPRGLAEAYNIANSQRRLIALAFGAEDYTAAVGAKRTREGIEILAARSAIINAAAAAGVVALDTPYTDVNDEAGLVTDVSLARQLGFKGKLAIHPRQVDVIHAGFNPSLVEIRWAERVLAVIRQAKEEGSGVVALDGKMIDAPIVLRAQQVLNLAKLVEGKEV